jgi:transposase-like protein
MRKIRELLRLHFEQGFSQRLIARSLGVVRSTVERVLQRFAESGLTWPPDPAFSDEELERRLYRRAAVGQRFVTDPQEMPAHHRAYTDPRILQRAARIGPITVALIEALFARRRHPEQAIRGAPGILGLHRDHRAEALEPACAQTLVLDRLVHNSERIELSGESMRKRQHYNPNEDNPPPTG